MRIIGYKILHATPKAQDGGAKKGFLSVSYQETVVSVETGLMLGFISKVYYPPARKTN